jgi:trehalose/maltose transport system permease protein
MEPDTTPVALRPRLPQRAIVAGFLALWCFIAAFPLVWIAVMSFRAPQDALSADPLRVLLGPTTRAAGGLSMLDLALGLAFIWLAWRGATRGLPALARRADIVPAPLRWIALALGWLLATGLAALLLPWLARLLTAVFGAIPLLELLARPVIGITLQHYHAVWVRQEFYRNFLNSMMVTVGVVVISLSVGTLAGYALARSASRLAFWLLIAALAFRALPHSVLATGYVPFFLNSREILAPLWQWPATAWLFTLFADRPPLLYGQPLATIIVLVSINQPFTIWMLRSFFQNIPAELDEAARVDGCSHFEAFWRAIMPVMWPGVITTGLFSFLLAYNDYLVTALLLDAQSMTMVPAITQFLNRDTRLSDQIEAIAAAVSITAPLFVLVLAFQRQIVAGLTQGAVKG